MILKIFHDMKFKTFKILITQSYDVLFTSTENHFDIIQCYNLSFCLYIFSRTDEQPCSTLHRFQLWPLSRFFSIVVQILILWQGFVQLIFFFFLVWTGILQQYYTYSLRFQGWLCLFYWYISNEFSKRLEMISYILTFYHLRSLLCILSIHFSVLRKKLSTQSMRKNRWRCFGSSPVVPLKDGNGSKAWTRQGN